MSRRINAGHLGFYRPGKLVVLGEWVFSSPHDPGMVVPRDWRGGWWNPTKHRVVSNYASTSGFVVLENISTHARTEHDWQTPVISDWSEP